MGGAAYVLYAWWDSSPSPVTAVAGTDPRAIPSRHQGTCSCHRGVRAPLAPAVPATCR